MGGAGRPGVEPVTCNITKSHASTNTASWYSILKFFVLDVLLRRVVAVSSDPAPDSAFAPSFFGRPSGQLPVVPLYDVCLCFVRRNTSISPSGIVDHSIAWGLLGLLESLPPLSGPL